MTQDNSAAADVWTAIKAQPIAMLVTMHEGKFVSRPMAAHAEPAEHALYFVSKLESIKTHDISERSLVNLSFADPAKSTFISVAGHATVSQDREKLRELWSMWAEAWLPEGPDSPETALITVDPVDAVIWNSDNSKVVRMLKTATAAVTQSPPHMGTVRKVEL